MKFSARTNLGLKSKQAEAITVEIENSLREEYPGVVAARNVYCEQGFT